MQLNASVLPGGPLCRNWFRLLNKINIWARSHKGVVFSCQVSGSWAPLTSIKHPFVTAGGLSYLLGAVCPSYWGAGTAFETWLAETCRRETFRRVRWLSSFCMRKLQIHLKTWEGTARNVSFQYARFERTETMQNVRSK